MSIDEHFEDCSGFLNDQDRNEGGLEMIRMIKLRQNIGFKTCFKVSRGWNLQTSVTFERIEIES